jgi:hypothetical protein
MPPCGLLWGGIFTAPIPGCVGAVLIPKGQEADHGGQGVTTALGVTLIW